MGKQISLIEWMKEDDSIFGDKPNGYTATWKNGKRGTISIVNAGQVNCCLKFAEVAGSSSVNKEQMYNHDVLLPNGFLLHCVLTLWAGGAIDYKRFYNVNKGRYVEQHKNEPDAWKRDLSGEWLRLHYDYMKQQPSNSVPLFEYISDSDVNLLQEYQRNYIMYLETLLPKQPTTTDGVGEFATNEAKTVLDKAIKVGLCDGNYNWLQSEALWGYFVDKVSNLLDIRSSNGRIKWKPFQRLFNMPDKDVNVARQAVNDYKNKGLNPPEGDDIVNSILK